MHIVTMLRLLYTRPRALVSLIVSMVKVAPTGWPSATATPGPWSSRDRDRVSDHSHRLGGAGLVEFTEVNVVNPQRMI